MPDNSSSAIRAPLYVFLVDLAEGIAPTINDTGITFIISPAIDRIETSAVASKHDMATRAFLQRSRFSRFKVGIVIGPARSTCVRVKSYRTERTGLKGSSR